LYVIEICLNRIDWVTPLAVLSSVPLLSALLII